MNRGHGSNRGHHHPGRGRGYNNHRGQGSARGRGRGRGGWGRGRGGRNQHNRRRFYNNNNNNNNNPSHNKGYNPSAFDPIEEIGDINHKQSSSSNVVRIAVEGCCHGELDLIYQRLLDHQQSTGNSIDLLVCCGDFQSLRNPADFHSTSIPPKYQALGTFPKYYSGQAVAPILTIFIGGNHEAGQPLRELYYGGWVAPGIYYLGACGVVQYRGIRIGGISGIYKSFDYTQGHHEEFPLDRRSVKSIYHVRKVDVERAKLLAKNSSPPLDVFVSHDWPQGIEQHGNTRNLIQRKPYFRQEIEANDLGSPANREILDVLKPKHWFSAHLHVKFHAMVVHGKPNTGSNAARAKPKPKSNLSPTSFLLAPSQVAATSSTTKEEKAAPPDPTTEDDEGAITGTTQFHGMETSEHKCIPSFDGDEDGSMEMNAVEDLTQQMTKFLALDKCLPRRQFLSVLNVQIHDTKGETPPAGEFSSKSREFHLEYDPEWLAIVKNTHHWTRKEQRKVTIPPLPEERSKEYFSVEWVKERFREHKSAIGDHETPSLFEIPRDFVPTVPFHTDEAFQQKCPPLPVMGNPQTDRLLEILQLEHIVTVPYDPDLTPEVISARLQGKPCHWKPSMNRNTSNRNINLDASMEDENEIDIESEESETDDANGTQAKIAIAVLVQDDNEIDIDIDDCSHSETDKNTAVCAATEDSNEIDINDEESDGDSADIENSVTKKARLEE